MAKLIFGMMQSLDGYIAGVEGGPDVPIPGPALHRPAGRSAGRRRRPDVGWPTPGGHRPAGDLTE